MFCVWDIDDLNHYFQGFLNVYQSIRYCDFESIPSHRTFESECRMKKSRGVCETLTMPPAATKSKKAIFSAKVKVKVTMPLTLVTFERASLVEYACQI